MLRGRVRTHAAGACYRGHRCRVADGAARSALHQRQFVLHPEKHALEIHTEHVLVIIRRIVLDTMSTARYAGVVERRVEPTRFRADARDERLDVPLLGNIGADNARSTAGLRDQVTRLGQFPFLPPGAIHERASGSENTRGFASDAGAGARNENDLVLKITGHANSPIGRVDAGR